MSAPNGIVAGDLAGKVCVVTGAGGGIGRGIANALAREGARLALLDVSLEHAQITADQVRANGAEAVAITCDVSSQNSVTAAAASVLSQFGNCSVLVNNAGVLRPASLAAISLAEWNLLLSINLTGHLLCAQAFRPQMVAKGGGSIVNIASIAASQVTALGGAYSVSKAAIVMLSHQLAVEWGKDGIRSNVVNPGLILTPMSQAFYDQPGAAEKRAAVVPRGRIGTPADIAEAVVFLASDKADYISGAEITVDGGFTRNFMSLIPRVGYEAR
jgi:NAD(P)-dependent dehydrogenase (short-subunit alcohol dehydrogenase family)